MNWIQRLLLVLAGLFLLMLAFGIATGSYGGSTWMALIEFLLAVGCFILAAMPVRKSDG